MAKDKLVVIEDGYEYRIAWWLADEQDEGLGLGQDTADTYPITAEALATFPADEWETRLAEHIAGQDPLVLRGHDGYFWDTKTAATNVLKLIRLALKEGKGKPWPSWALAAKAAGWTPPARWQP